MDTYDEIVEGFNIQLHFEDEYLSPEDLFDDEEDIKNVYEGRYTWAIAMVSASKCGIELGRTTLGGLRI